MSSPCTWEEFHFLNRNRGGADGAKGESRVRGGGGAGKIGMRGNYNQDVK